MRLEIQRIEENSNKYAAPSVKRGMVMSMRFMVMYSSRGWDRTRRAVQYPAVCIAGSFSFFRGE